MKKYHYLLSLLFVFTIPTLILGLFAWPIIDMSNLIGFMIGITILGSVWDVWATKHGRIDPAWLWQFNNRETLGIKLFDLPLEEYLFYVSTSAYIIFIWETMRYASETADYLAYLLLPFIALWSLLFILLPYYLAARQGRALD
ncbi:MAG: lycopene cyclase domain-containing protein [Candidatus Taylorbacteria bacterium]|nr:lycopene cyclase domain-containing protein [Candidatus Taylorbacteria bacterium]